MEPGADPGAETGGGGRRAPYFGIESVNVHDAIKTGAADRDVYIGRYIETLENLGQEDIHLVCYNFMPVFDWTRTELARLRPDGSTVLAYTQEAVDRLDPETMFSSIAGGYERHGPAGLGAGAHGPGKGAVCHVPGRG